MNWEALTTWIVWKLPRTIIYWATVRLMTSVNRNAPDDLKPSDYLKAYRPVGG